MTDDQLLLEPDVDELELDEYAAALPVHDATKIPPPPEQEQDKLDEGLGSPRPRPWRQAIAAALNHSRRGWAVEVGYCLRYTRGWYDVAPKYLSAVESGRAARPQRRLERGQVVPAGAIVYWMGPRTLYGHIAPSVGGGFVLSTDWPRGRVGRVGIWELADAWGYDEVWWSPVVNDVRVWAPALKVSISVVNRVARRGGIPVLPKRRAMVRRVNRALRRHGYLPKSGVRMARYQRAAVRRFQLAQGWTGAGADGLLGPMTLQRLGIKRYRK